jgi:hypothetical protein
MFLEDFGTCLEALDFKRRFDEMQKVFGLVSDAAVDL